MERLEDKDRLIVIENDNSYLGLPEAVIEELKAITPRFADFLKHEQLLADYLTRNNT